MQHYKYAGREGKAWLLFLTPSGGGLPRLYGTGLPRVVVYMLKFDLG